MIQYTEKEKQYDTVIIKCLYKLSHTNQAIVTGKKGGVSFYAKLSLLEFYHWPPDQFPTVSEFETEASFIA